MYTWNSAALKVPNPGGREGGWDGPSECSSAGCHAAKGHFQLFSGGGCSLPTSKKGLENPPNPLSLPRPHLKAGGVETPVLPEGGGKGGGVHAGLGANPVLPSEPEELRYRREVGEGGGREGKGVGIGTRLCVTQMCMRVNVGMVGGGWGEERNCWEVATRGRNAATRVGKAG